MQPSPCAETFRPCPPSTRCSMAARLPANISRRGPRRRSIPSAPPPVSGAARRPRPRRPPLPDRQRRPERPRRAQATATGVRAMNETEALLRRTAPDPGGPLPAMDRPAAAAGLLDVAYAIESSPVGTLLLASTQRGLVRIAYLDAGED